MKKSIFLIILLLPFQSYTQDPIPKHKVNISLIKPELEQLAGDTQKEFIKTLGQADTLEQAAAQIKPLIETQKDPKIIGATISILASHFSVSLVRAAIALNTNQSIEFAKNFVKNNQEQSRLYLLYTIGQNDPLSKAIASLILSDSTMAEYLKQFTHPFHKQNLLEYIKNPPAKLIRGEAFDFRIQKNTRQAPR